jgi:hypothetical protein
VRVGVAHGRQSVLPGEGIERLTWTLMGVKASRLAKALSDPLKRRLTLAEGRTTEAKRRFRRGIAERGEGHMKGVESIYTSGEEAIKAGSAGQGTRAN